MSTIPLLDAIRHDSLIGIRKYLEQHSPDLNNFNVLCDEFEIDDPDEIPLLFWVIQSGASLEAIKLLIDHGLKLDEVNREGLGALDIAIKNRRRDVVELCGEAGISFVHSRRRSGLTPLMLAASLGDREMVDLLLEHGATVEDTDKRGTDAIEYARILGQAEMVKYLEKLRGKPKEAQKEKQEV